jgi:hypothetical protein
VLRWSRAAGRTDRSVFSAAPAGGAVTDAIQSDNALCHLTEPSQLGSFDAGMLFVFNKGTAKVSTTF